MEKVWKDIKTPDGVKRVEAYRLSLRAMGRVDSILGNLEKHFKDGGVSAVEGKLAEVLKMLVAGGDLPDNEFIFENWSVDSLIEVINQLMMSTKDEVKEEDKKK